MAYNGRGARHDEVQYQSGSQGYGGQNGHNTQQYQSRGAAYPVQDGGGYERHQNERVYANNQQYSQNYDPAWEQYQEQGQYPQDTNGYGTPHDPYQQQQRQAPSRTYQYDERYRTNGRDVAQRGGIGLQGARRSPPQPRPGTSASDKRHKKERILGPAEDSPKAMAWDNPFGAFPGTKKGAEEKKKKQAEEAKSDSRAATPSGAQQTQSTSSPRRPTTADPSASITTTNPSLDERRPNTSHSRQPQPRTDSNATSGTYMGSSDDIPLRKRPLQPRGPPGTWGQSDQYPYPHDNKNKLGLPVRPAPHTSATGPSPERQPLPQKPYDDYHQMNAKKSNQGQQKFLKNKSNDNGHPYETTADNERVNWQHIYDPNSDNSNVGFPPSDQDQYQDGRQHHKVRNQGGMPPSKGYDNLAYRGLGPTKPTAASLNPMMPNFAAMAPDATADIEKEVTPQAAPAYRKPTYGEAASNPSLDRSQTAGSFEQDHTKINVQPSVAEFNFGLPESNLSTQCTPQPAELNSGYGSRHEYQQPPYQASRQQHFGQQQHPSGSGNRPDVRGPPPANGFSHPYNQPPLSRQQDQFGQRVPAGQARRDHRPNNRNYAPRQEYGFDDQGHPQDSGSNYGAHQQDYGHGQDDLQQTHNQEPRLLQRTQTAPVGNYDYDHDQYNHGYHQAPPTKQAGYVPEHSQYASLQQTSRAPPQQYASDHPYDQNGYTVPLRPRTANSARTPVRQHSDEPLPIPQPPASGFPTSDRAHPIPIRPGLTMPAPAATPVPMPMPPQQGSPPRNVQQGGSGSQQGSRLHSSAPVTINELNDLREAFKNRPNDDQLGLRFAKRLVDAAKTLANEGGKADAKQTARNRERYINDAYKIVKKLVAAGSPDAMFYLADCHGQGLLGLQVDAKEAFGLYTSAAKIGHAQSAYRVAVCCELGNQEGGGTRRDHVKAVQFYKRAATLGDPPAMYKMGMILLKGLLGQQPNPREGISWLKRAAERATEENPHALHELGLLYESAKSTDVILRDEAYALQLFTQAAKLGYKYSQHRLGSAYEYGTLGCTIDPRQSIHWYGEAAKQREHQSEFALSGWYLTGSPPLLEQSDTEAYLWARKAATSGLGKAEYAMGYYTEVGIGVTPDVEEAKKWYFRAAAQGDMRARERLEELKRGATRRKRDRVSRSDVGRKNEGECAVM